MREGYKGEAGALGDAGLPHAVANGLPWKKRASMRLLLKSTLHHFCLVPGLIDRSASFNEKEDCKAVWMPGWWRAICKDHTSHQQLTSCPMDVCVSVCASVCLCVSLCCLLSMCGHGRLLLAMLVQAVVSKIINISLIIKVTPKVEFMKLWT